MSAPDLASLVDAYAEAKEAEAAAADRVNDLRDQLLTIKDERDDPWDSAPLVGRMHQVIVSTHSSWRIDSTRLKVEQPALYAAFARQSTSTRLTVVAR